MPGDFVEGNTETQNGRHVKLEADWSDTAPN